jgi:hypothetical protein
MQEAALNHVSQSVAVWTSSDTTECSLTLLTVFNTNCYCLILILCEKVEVHADEEPRDKSKRKMISHQDKLDRGMRTDDLFHIQKLRQASAT